MLCCEAQLIPDYAITEEVSRIIINYHENGIDRFSIEYKDYLLSRRSDRVDFFLYKFIDDSTVIHNYKHLESTYRLRNGQFYTLLSEQERAYHDKQNNQREYFQIEYDSAGYRHILQYLVLKSESDLDTILIYHGIVSDTLSQGLYSESKRYDYRTGQLDQIDKYYRLANDTIRRIYHTKQDGKLGLLEDTKFKRTDFKKKKRMGYYKYTVGRHRIHGTSPVQYSTSEATMSYITYYDNTGMVKKIIKRIRGKKAEKLLPKKLK